MQHPALNATVEDAECSAVVRHGAHHIGIAMDTSRGLVVPVVKDVQAKSVLEVRGWSPHDCVPKR